MDMTAIPDEHSEFHERQAAVIDKILKMPVEELFIVKEVKPEIPVRAKIFASIQCASCGKRVTEHRARVRNGKFICIPCNEKCGGGSGEGNSILKTRYADQRENNPNTDSDSFFYCLLVYGKPRETLLFSSCGEYA
jgi:ribosomal protein L37AE/L43A